MNTMCISYRIGNIDDLQIITDLSVIMCSGDYCGEYSEDELYARNKDDLSNPERAMFIAFDGNKAVGFSHVALKNEWCWTEGDSSPTGHLEAIFVCSDYRKRGIAEKLVTMCEDWARVKGCVEFASDCDLDNEGSLAFHLKIGFTETHRIIHFGKRL